MVANAIYSGLVLYSTQYNRERERVSRRMVGRMNRSFHFTLLLWRMLFTTEKHFQIALGKQINDLAIKCDQLKKKTKVKYNFS